MNKKNITLPPAMNASKSNIPWKGRPSRRSLDVASRASRRASPLRRAQAAGKAVVFLLWGGRARPLHLAAALRKPRGRLSCLAVDVAPRAVCGDGRHASPT